MSVSVLAVDDWDRYVDNLQPDFSITADQALAQVVPQTREFEQSVERATSAQLEAAIEGEIPEKRETDDEAIPAVMSGSVSAPAIELVEPPKLDGAVEVEPFTRYSAATALFQEIQLLAGYLQSAAVQEGYDPYIIRMQVALMPYARNQPYDTYVNISFTPTCSNEEDRCKIEKAVKVLPLLVTENLESSLENRRFSGVTEFAAAVSALASANLIKVRAGIGWRTKLERIQAALGNDLNSLLMVTSPSAETLRIRFGAMNQGSARQAMVPRTHNVTFLMLVPQSAIPPDREIPRRSVSYVAQAEFVHVRTGKALPASSLSWDHRTFERLASLYGMEWSVECRMQLLEHVRFRNYVGFSNSFDPSELNVCGLLKQGEILAVWNGLISTFDLANEISFGTFDIPSKTYRFVQACSGRPKGEYLGDGAYEHICDVQSLTIYDDGSKARLSITNVDHGIEKRMSAELVAEGETMLQSMVATRVAYLPRTGVVTLEFPSPSALLGDGRPDRHRELERMTYELRLRQIYPQYVDNQDAQDYADTFIYKGVKLVVVRKKDATADPNVDPVPWNLPDELATAYVGVDNEATVFLQVSPSSNEKVEGGMELTSNGCNIEDVAAHPRSSLVDRDGKWEIKAATRLTISIKNAPARGSCTLVFTGIDGAKDTRSELTFMTAPAGSETAEDE